MFYNLIRKFGIIPLVIIVSFITVCISGGVTTITLCLLTGEIYIPGLVLSILVPGLLAPPQLFFYFRNSVKQRKSEEELQEAYKKLESEYREISKQREELRHLNASMEDVIAERTINLEKALKEKETLLSEIHHRVRNNLQIVISLLRLRKLNNKDENEMQMLTDIENKIMAMSLVHEQLYNESNFSEINLKIFLNKLVDNILLSYTVKHEQIKIIRKIDPVPLEMGNLMPLCLIITEIITNSFKYAFPGNRKGVIMISIKKDDSDKLTLVLKDDGVGYKQLNQSSLGINIIHALVNQLDGTIEIKSKNGVSYFISIPLCNKK